MSAPREWTEAELMSERPRGELLLRNAKGELWQVFVCHGCQSCWEMDSEALEIIDVYPHFLSAAAVVEITV